jgi:hypothetical protein
MTQTPAHQGMTTQQITTLLARIGAFDARTVGESEIQAWGLIAERGRWTLAEATEQVIKYFETDQPGWLMPGKINAMIREARQDRAMREPIAPPVRGVLDGGPWPVGDDPHWGARNSPELELIHSVCMPFFCAYCHQPANERCKNRVTGNATKIPHLSRLQQAGVNHNYP